jgi:hypothetical protein
MTDWRIRSITEFLAFQHAQITQKGLATPSSDGAMSPGASNRTTASPSMAELDWDGPTRVA